MCICSLSAQGFGVICHSAGERHSHNLKTAVCALCFLQIIYHRVRCKRHLFLMSEIRNAENLVLEIQNTEIQVSEIQNTDIMVSLPL